MQLVVTPGSSLPIYRQIVEQIKNAIAGGHLQPGEQLPSHREVAAQAVIAPLTVKKAYDLLHREGYIRIAQGQGTFVGEGPIRLDPSERMERLRPFLEKVVHESTLLDVSPQDTITALRKEFEKTSAGKGKK